MIIKIPEDAPRRPVLLGDMVKSVAQPIAKVIDKVLDTDLEHCKSCEERRRRLNELSLVFVNNLSALHPQSELANPDVSTAEPVDKDADSSHQRQDYDDEGNDGVPSSNELD